jgi:hypothetical protein
VYVNENARGEFPISSTQKHVVKKNTKARAVSINQIMFWWFNKAAETFS